MLGGGGRLLDFHQGFATADSGCLHKMKKPRASSLGKIGLSFFGVDCSCVLASVSVGNNVRWFPCLPSVHRVAVGSSVAADSGDVA